MELVVAMRDLILHCHAKYNAIGACKLTFSGSGDGKERFGDINVNPGPGYSVHCAVRSVDVRHIFDA